MFKLEIEAITQNQPGAQAQKRERKLRRMLGELITAAADAGYRATFSLEKIEPAQNDNNPWDKVLEQ